MKKTIALFLLGFTLATYSQEASKTIDPKLVGCWRGSEIEQHQKGLSKYWVACRFEDGTSTLLFIAIDKKGNVKQTTENGKWWVQDGKFYELHNFDGVVDIYNYEVKDDSIKFSAIEVMGDPNSKYTFYDYKIED